MMSVLKKGSRNAFNNGRESDESVTDYEGISGVRLPSADTVDEIMRKTDENCSEKLKFPLRRNGWKTPEEHMISRTAD